MRNLAPVLPREPQAPVEEIPTTSLGITRRAAEPPLSVGRRLKALGAVLAAYAAAFVLLGFLAQM
ncbi:MAG: hypothetical protein Kow0092_28530 [Deferrisomatales bacterium]